MKEKNPEENHESTCNQDEHPLQVPIKVAKQIFAHVPKINTSVSRSSTPVHKTKTYHEVEGGLESMKTVQKAMIVK